MTLRPVYECRPSPDTTVRCSAGSWTAGDKTIFGFADLIPTRAHVRLPWIMGYDLYPVETLEAKKLLIPRAAREGWLCLFYHDADEPLCRLVEGDKGFTPVPYRGDEANDS
jgi:hypothetical protein